MNTTTIEQIISNGIFCFLFCSLFFYELKKNDEREKRLMTIINELKEKIFDEINEIKEIITDGKNE